MKTCVKNLFLLPALIAGLSLIPAGRVTAQTFTNLHSFTSGSDGANPVAGLILSGNTLYGTAYGGGSSGKGTVFKVNTNGTGFTRLYSFTGGSDGANPQAGLILSGNTLYGTTYGGGSSGSGTVFAVLTDGTGFTILHSFTAIPYPNYTNSDGANPEAGLILSGNTLYGTAYWGGSGGNGTVFKVSIFGGGFTNLHSFTAGPGFGYNNDGANPEAGLILSGNTLYGTAFQGGSSRVGTVFAVNTDGTGFTNLHNFANYPSGAYPSAGLILSGNTLYGTTSQGGSWGYYNGTVFAVHTNGTGFTILHSFNYSDGAKPYAGLILSSNTLYGTTYDGGSSTDGTVFAVNTNGTGFTTLYSFTATPNSSPYTNRDGAGPQAGLILSDNTLYGTAYWGGSSGNGTVFSLTSGLAPDLVATSLSWNSTTNGGLDFTYANQGVPLPAATTAKIFWANGTNIANAFTNAQIYTTNIPAGFSGQATNHVPELWLPPPPINATYLLLVLDPGNLITESTKTNNTLALRNTFRHVVLVMMENRSFDHFLGWLPGTTNGRQAGLTYTNASGQSFPTWHLAPYFQGCGCQLPDQSFGAIIQYNNGLCDGWLRANTNDTYSIGYYDQYDLPFFGQVAPNWTVCDHYFAAIMAETQPNRIYQHTAQTDSLTNRAGFANLFNPVNLPTIWDRLSQSNINARYYYAGATPVSSVLSLWGPSKYFSISYGTKQFYQDCMDGTLPAVSFVDPDLTSTLLIGDTAGNDDHPHADIRNGEAFLASIYNAVASSPNWSSTVLIINFDEWGGFFDHVPPPMVIITGEERALGNDGRLGFRVPCLVISPWSRGASVASEQFDHTSVLKLIENRWGLLPLTVRDREANDLADVLDFDHPNFTAPPPVMGLSGRPFGGPCQELRIAEQDDGSIVVSWDATCRKLLLQTRATFFDDWINTTNTVSPFVLTPAQAQLYHYRLQMFRFEVVK